MKFEFTRVREDEYLLVFYRGDDLVANFTLSGEEVIHLSGVLTQAQPPRIAALMDALAWGRRVAYGYEPREPFLKKLDSMKIYACEVCGRRAVSGYDQKCEGCR